MLYRIINYILQLIYPIFRSVFPYELFAYLAVGAMNTALNIIIFAIIYNYIALLPEMHIHGYSIANYTIALLVAFIATAPTGYWLARHFAFTKSKTQRVLLQFIKYLVVVVQGLISDYLILKALIVVFNVYPTIAKIISTIIVLSLNYILQKFFTFQVRRNM